MQEQIEEINIKLTLSLCQGILSEHSLPMPSSTEKFVNN